MGTVLVVASDYERDTDYQEDLDVYNRPNDRIQWHHKKALSFIRQSVAPNCSALDVGCFDGFFVRKLRTYGYEAHGVDFNNRAIAEGIVRYRLEGRLSTKAASELVAEGKKYDIVSLFEVVEHLDDFNSVMRDCISLIKPGGYLFVSTPNANMSWRPPLDFPPHHLSRFTPSSLRGLAELHNLHPIEIIEQSSCFELVRHWIGLKFRHPETESMRGGGFQNRLIVDPLRKFVTRTKWLFEPIFAPIDWLFSKFGFRYMGQLLIAQKMTD